MNLGIDYSSGRPAADKVKAAGFSVILRYLSRNPSKNLTPGEAKAALDAGLDVVVVWETTATRTLAGAPGGKVDGAAAKAQAEACGAPPSAAIYFAVDFDVVRSGDFDTIEAYLRAAGEACAPHPVGVYGEYDVVAKMLARGAAKYGWQTAAWSSRRRLQAAHIFQRIGQVKVDGVTCDVNEIQQPEYGGFRQASPAPAPAEKPAVLLVKKGAPEGPLLRALLPLARMMTGPYFLTALEVREVDPANVGDVPGWSVAFGFNLPGFESVYGARFADTVPMLIERLGIPGLARVAT